MDAQNIPGYSIAVTSKGLQIYSNSYGFSDIKLKEKVNNQTLIQIGSITKSFTAISLMQLYDSGKFDLHKPVSEYMEWFDVTDEIGVKVTGHHLLTHKSRIQVGLGGFYGSPTMAVYASQLKLQIQSCSDITRTRRKTTKCLSIVTPTMA